ncbi:MAG: SCO family protein [Hyphomicrobium sp.]|nr:SCO family protein [Hyphomicrobium sp.]
MNARLSGHTLLLVRSLALRLAFITAIVAVQHSLVAGSPDNPLALKFGGPFALVDHAGKMISDRDFRGRFMLIYFGYTHCPDICPVDLSVLTEAIDIAGSAGAKVDPVFITLDPARDTPELLAKYRNSFHPRLVALSGSETAIAAVAKAYRVHRRKYIVDQAHPERYGIDHGSLSYLMGPDGKFLTLIPRGTPAGRIAELIRKYTSAPATPLEQFQKP